MVILVRARRLAGRIRLPDFNLYWIEMKILGLRKLRRIALTLARPDLLRFTLLRVFRNTNVVTLNTVGNGYRAWAN
jgi:hypothetical protein